jgi:DNA-binding YbaB/EbfC family protein
MADMNALMKQAQMMQARMAAAQDKIAALEVEGTAGGGAVRLRMKGTGEMSKLDIDESLMAPGEADMVADLVMAAHADAKRQIDAQQASLMREAAGPLAGLNIPGMPKF